MVRQALDPQAAPFQAAILGLHPPHRTQPRPGMARLRIISILPLQLSTLPVNLQLTPIPCPMTFSRHLSRQTISLPLANRPLFLPITVPICTTVWTFSTPRIYGELLPPIINLPQMMRLVASLVAQVAKTRAEDLMICGTERL